MRGEEGEGEGKRKDERGREAKGICHCCILKPNPPQLSEIYLPHLHPSVLTKVYMKCIYYIQRIYYAI